MIKVYYFTDNNCCVKLNVQRIDKSGPSKLLNENNECEMITYKQLRLEKKKLTIQDSNFSNRCWHKL